MIASFPLIWFSILFVYIFKKQGFKICAYVVLMYVITSLFALLMHNVGAGYSLYDNSVISSIVYCLLISLSFIPVYRLSCRGKIKVEISNPGFVKFLIYFYLFCFFFLFIFHWRDIIFRITFSDWDAIKSSATMGDAYAIRSFGGVLRPISIIVRVMSSVSFIMVPIFFLTFKTLKLPYYYSIYAMIGSISSFVVAILDADRSRIFIWLLVMGLCLVFFWGDLSDKVKRRVIPLIFLIFIVAFSYVYIVSISRFSEKSGGTMSSVIEYAGQPYSNFCYFFDNFNNGEGINTRVLFPFTHTFLFRDYIGGVDLQQTMTARTGIYCGVFYSFLGLFILDSNQIGPFLFIAFYLIIWSIVLRKRSVEVSLTRFLVYFFLLVIPTYGCIAYMYSHWYLTLSIFIILSLSKFTEKRKIQ